MDYGDNFDFFLEEYQNFEPSPLDDRPYLTDQVDKWFHRTYYDLKGLSGYEHQITITDLNSYFSIYHLPFDIFTVISTIKLIETKYQKYKIEQDELKKNSKNNQAVKK